MSITSPYKIILYLSLLFVISLLSTGCQSIQTPPLTCEQKYYKFSRVVSCLKQRTFSNIHLQSASERYIAQEYLNSANKLLEQVRNHRISDAQAKALLSATYGKPKKETYRPTQTVNFINSSTFSHQLQQNEKVEKGPIKPPPE